MRKILIESQLKYPYISINLEIDNFKKTDEALADTGFDLSLRMPKKEFDETKIKQKWTSCKVETGNGEVCDLKGYIGKITFGKKEFIGTIVVTEKGEELVIGMEILNELISTFDGPSQKLIIYTE